LRRGAIAGSDDWFVVEITPNGHPFEELASGLSAIALDPPVDLLDRLNDGHAGLRRVLHDILPADQSQLVLVIDQFEEVFTHGGAPAAQTFLDALADAVLDRWSRLRVVITIRADFHDRPLSSYAFGELVRKGTDLLTAMSPEELQRAIEGPADGVGVRFEPGVVAEIVSDVSDHTCALPLLQYALTELFDRRNGRVIELATYRELGGAAGALAQRADQVYDGLAPPEQETTRQLMLRLVNLGDGEDDVTRRRVLRRELLGIGDERTEVCSTPSRHTACSRSTETPSPVAPRWRSPTRHCSRSGAVFGCGSPTAGTTSGSTVVSPMRRGSGGTPPKHPTTCSAEAASKSWSRWPPAAPSG
jgi:hypothetical protein